MKRSLIRFLIFVAVVVGGGYAYLHRLDWKHVSSFAECKAAGFPVQESSPERCVAANGTVYTNAAPAASATPDREGQPITYQNLDVPAQATWQVDSPRLVVAQNQANWDDLWQNMTEKLQPRPAEPKIDFSKAMVIGLFDGQKPTGGYKYVIDQIVETDTAIQVRMREEMPGAGCAVPQIITFPQQIVTVAPSTKGVEVQRTQLEVPCQ